MAGRGTEAAIVAGECFVNEMLAFHFPCLFVRLLIVSVANKSKQSVGFRATAVRVLSKVSDSVMTIR